MRASAWISLTCVALGLACSDEIHEQAELRATIYVPQETRFADVLIVIDDSGSMTDLQETFANNIGAFGQIFEYPDARLDARVAVTTTSVPGPTCAGPLARGGELLTDSCRAAPSEAFMGPGELSVEIVDQRSLCTDACTLDSIDLRPSPLDDYGEELAIRPWLEGRTNSYDGNLPADLSLADAMRCVGLRGFGGCAFESPLAAASRALEHMRSPGDPAHGFLREDTPLLILFIGDEDDCSHHDASATIFDPAGERVFWSDPAAEAPSSAVCHNAGTRCDADGCVSVDRDLQGEETSDYAHAALRSLVEFRAEIDTLRLERTVFVSLLGGVSNNGSLAWWPSNDDAWIEAFGWGPGCEGPGGERAQPPGRLYELTSTDFGAFSICNWDWTGALFDITSWVGPQANPWCGPPGTDDTSCEMIVRTAANEIRPVPACLRDEQGFILDAETDWYSVPEGAQRCHAILTDTTQSDDPADDVSDFCIDGGRETELKIAARPGALPLPRDSVYELVCTPV